MISSIQSGSYGNSFKANVHMDLKVQDACKKSGELKNFVEFLKNSVKCDEIYLSTKPQPGIISAYESYLMGQSVHRNGEIKDVVLGSLIHDKEKKDYAFREIFSDNKSRSKTPEDHYNNLLFYMA